MRTVHARRCRSGWQHGPVNVWDELTPEQYAVMINAIEEAYLNGVVYAYNLRVNGKRQAGALIAPPTSEDEVRSLIPRFAVVVADLIARRMVMLMTTDRWDELFSH